MTIFERIKAMSFEELAEQIGALDADEVILDAFCSAEFCEHYRDDGLCAGKGNKRCVPAAKKWLESEVKISDDGEKGDGRKEKH